MKSSSARSPLRLELRRSALRRIALAGFSLLAALALWQSSLSWPMAAALFLLTVALTVGEARRTEPVRLRIDASNVIRLDWPDGREAVVELASFRRVGGWLVLRVIDGGRSVWIDFWPDSLSDPDRKALLRRLSGSLSSAGRNNVQVGPV